MKSLRSFGLGVLLTATMAFSGVALASSGGPPSPNADPGSDGPAVVAPAALTPLARQQMLYSPIAPCRIVDTRNTTPLASGATRSFYVAGTFGFAPQGGKAGGCGIPLGATSVSVSVTAIDPSNTGFLQAWPSDNANAKVTVLNYATQGITSGANLGLALGSSPQLRVKNSGGPTDLAIDVTGYYRSQVYGTFASDGTVYDGNGTLVAYNHPSTGVYTVRSDRDLTGCAVTATSYYYAYNVSGYSQGNYVYLQMTNHDGTAVNYYFHVNVTC